MNDTWWVRPDELDSDQREIITLPLDASFLVTGPPGSGKTNLLLLRANYAAQGGLPNLLVLTITRTLREFLAAGSNRYAFPADKVKTNLRWSYDLLRDYGVVPIETTGGYNERRRSVLEQLEQLADQLNLSDIYEIILLDEAQDYWPREIDLFWRLSKHVFAVGDRHQKIYTGDDGLARLVELIGAERRLRFHYRNGIRICKLADGIAKPSRLYAPLAPTCHYDEAARPSSVEVFNLPSVAAQAAKVIHRLRVQLETYPGELIGVVVPRTEDLQRVWELVAESDVAEQSILQASDTGYLEFDEQHPVWVTTLHSCKGLEYRALHLVCADGLTKFPLNRNMTYTAVTRTKTSLSIYSTGGLPAYLEQALVGIEPPSELPTLADAFGGGGAR